MAVRCCSKAVNLINIVYEYQCGNTLFSNRLQLVNGSELFSQYVINRTDLVTAIRSGY